MKRILFLLFLLPSALFSQTQKLFTQFPLKSYIGSDTSWIFLQADPVTAKIYRTPLQSILNAVSVSNLLPNGMYDDVSVYSNGTSILINDQKVTNNKLALMPPGTLKGNLTGSSGAPNDNNQTAVRNFLNYHSVAVTGNYLDLINRPTIPSQFNPIAGNYIGLTGTYPNITIANTMPVLNLIAGTNVTVSGTYPNLTVNSISTSIGDNSMTALANDPTTGELDNQEFGLFKHTGTSQINLFVNDGGVIKKAGGSNTLDQTLALGNVTDSVIIFDPNTYATNYEFIKVNPIDTFSSQVPFRMTRWSYPQNSGAVSGNEGLMFGFNINSGGGIIESGKPAIGFSMETNYLPDYITRYVEWHDIYIPSATAGGLTAGNQVRLKSYTINTATNVIDMYNTVSREYNYLPGTSIQYWEVEPGSFTMKDAADTMSVIQQLINDSYIIAGTGMSYLYIQGFANVSLSGATLTNLTLSTLNIQNANVSYTSLNSNISIHGHSLISPNPSKYLSVDIDDGSNTLLYTAAGGMNTLQYTNITTFNNYQATGVYWNSQFRFYSNGSHGYLMTQSDLSMTLGYNSGERFSDAFVKYGHFNQLEVQSKAGNPTTSDIDSGMWMVWKNTTTGDTYIYMNDGGTMKRINSAFVTF